MDLKQQYEQLDHRLAMIDGRFKVIKPKRDISTTPAVDHAREAKKALNKLSREQKNALLVELLGE